MWQYFWTGGRSTRLEWWIIHVGVLIGLRIVGQIYLAAHRAGVAMSGLPYAIWVGFSLLLLWLSFASIVRRLHARNKSGWWSLPYLVPFLGWAWMFIECGFLKDRAPPAPVAPATVQRLEQPTLTWRGAAKLAGISAGLVLFALFLRAWTGFGEPAQVGSFKNVTGALEAQSD